MSVRDGDREVELSFWPNLAIGTSHTHPAWFNVLDRILMGLTAAASLVAVIALGVIATLMATGVWYRYVIDEPLLWTDTIVLWSFIWMIFVGASVPLSSSMHFAVEALVVGLDSRIQRTVALVGNILSLIFCVIVTKEGAWLTAQNLRQLDPALGLPFAIPYASVPIGFALMSLVLLRHCLALVFNFNKASS